MEIGDIVRFFHSFSVLDSADSYQGFAIARLRQAAPLGWHSYAPCGTHSGTCNLRRYFLLPAVFSDALSEVYLPEEDWVQWVGAYEIKYRFLNQKHNGHRIAIAERLFCPGQCIRCVIQPGIRKH
jgi:hypothetical protein